MNTDIPIPVSRVKRHKPATPETEEERVARITALGRRLRQLREEYVASGGRLYSVEEIQRELEGDDEDYSYTTE